MKQTYIVGGAHASKLFLSAPVFLASVHCIERHQEDPGSAGLCRALYAMPLVSRSDEGN